RADLSNTRLINTNLSGANLRDANLVHADLSDANVEKARFGNNQGISEKIKDDLIRRGAIFIGEPPTQDSRVLVPDFSQTIKNQFT
ncbi:MAG: pentapeptide repeat-containing protein, partial [Nostoc sp.]